MAGAADLQRFVLRAHAVGLVNVVDSSSIPDATIALVCLDGLDCFGRGRTFNAFGRNLPATLLGDLAAFLQRHAIIFLQSLQTAHVDHFLILPCFSLCLIITCRTDSVKGFLQKTFSKNFSKRG